MPERTRRETVSPARAQLYSMAKSGCRKKLALHSQYLWDREASLAKSPAPAKRRAGKLGGDTQRVRSTWSGIRRIRRMGPPSARKGCADGASKPAQFRRMEAPADRPINSLKRLRMRAQRPPVILEPSVSSRREPGRDGRPGPTRNQVETGSGGFGWRTTRR